MVRPPSELLHVVTGGRPIARDYVVEVSIPIRRQILSGELPPLQSTIRLAPRPRGVVDRRLDATLGGSGDRERCLAG